jgi:hypothetical protein
LDKGRIGKAICRVNPPDKEPEKQQQDFKLILDVHVAWSETRVPQNPMVGNFGFALFNDQ